MKYLLSDRLPKLAANLDPSGTSPNQSLMALDHNGRRWLAYFFEIDHVGKEPISMGETTFPGRIGIITDQGKFAPVEKTRVNDPLDRFSNYFRMTVNPDQSWTGNEKTMLALYEGEIVNPSASKLYAIGLNNSPGQVCVQQLVFIGSKNCRLASSSIPPTATDVVGDSTIYLWQEKMKTPTSDFSVRIKVRLEENGEPATRASGSGQ